MQRRNLFEILNDAVHILIYKKQMSLLRRIGFKHCKYSVCFADITVRNDQLYSTDCIGQQRIDGYGIAFHGGKNPGYPASHGCIRLPMKFAEKLYGLTKVGSQVVIEG